MLLNKEKVIHSIGECIDFVTDKMEVIVNEEQDRKKMDIKQMADFHRYSETVLNLTQALSVLEK